MNTPRGPFPFSTPDVVPYDKETADGLARILCALPVKSIGPGCATLLLTMAREIDEACDRPDLEAVAWPLRAYAQRLRDIAIVEGARVPIVIEQLQAIVKPKTQEPPMP